jgi:hypothetical protein
VLPERRNWAELTAQRDRANKVLAKLKIERPRSTGARKVAEVGGPNRVATLLGAGDQGRRRGAARPGRGAPFIGRDKAGATKIVVDLDVGPAELTGAIRPVLPTSALCVGCQPSTAGCRPTRCAQDTQA